MKRDNWYRCWISRLDPCTLQWWCLRKFEKCAIIMFVNLHQELHHYCLSHYIWILQSIQIMEGTHVRKSCKIQLKTWFWSIFWLLSGSIGSGTHQNIFKMILTCKATPNYPTNTLVHANMCENTIFSSTEPSLQKTAVFCRLGSSKTAILSCF